VLKHCIGWLIKNIFPDTKTHHLLTVESFDKINSKRCGGLSTKLCELQFLDNWERCYTLTIYWTIILVCNKVKNWSWTEFILNEVEGWRVFFCNFSLCRWQRKVKTNLTHKYFLHSHNPCSDLNLLRSRWQL